MDYIHPNPDAGTCAVALARPPERMEPRRQKAMRSILNSASLLALAIPTGLLAVGCAADVEDPTDAADETAQIDPSTAADDEQVGAAEEAAQAEDENVGTAEEAWFYGGYPYYGVGLGYPFYGYRMGFFPGAVAYGSSFAGFGRAFAGGYACAGGLCW
jgi:hypothetical protein